MFNANEIRQITFEKVVRGYRPEDVESFMEKIADEFKKKKRYRTVPTEYGEVLFPPFKLKISDTVTFGLKSFLCFHHVTCQGIKV